MGDASHYSDTILLAIEIISLNKVNKANYDRTVRALIKNCTNKATGLYLISYEGIEQTAYATSPDLKYAKGQGVYVLIPSNNSQRVKTIINTIDHLVTTTDGEKETSDLYNLMGPNALVPPGLSVLGVDYIIQLDGAILLSSYVNANVEIYNAEKLNNIFILGDNYEKYLRNSDGIVLKANLRTALPLEQQSEGVYGIKVTCRFKKNGNENQEILKAYTLSNLDVYGYPYTVIEKTNISHLEEFDGLNFIRIEKIEAYSKNFPISGSFSPDIFFSDLSIQGAGLLNVVEENNYLLFINYSANGDTIDKEGINKKLLLKGELKLKGVPITDNVEYYWFKENGTVFRNNSKYSSYGGEGWECLNNTDGKNYIGALNNNFYFFSGNISNTEKAKLTSNGKIPSALLSEKVLNIKCVAVYNRNKKIEGKGKVFNENINNQLVIFSSDDPSVDYYFGNGSPTLECLSQNDNGGVEKVGNRFTWSIEHRDGTSEIKESAAWAISLYFQAKQEYLNYENEYSKVADSNKAKYKQDHQLVINTWDVQKTKLIIQDNYYYNVNIDAIKDWARIICGVSNNDTYIGTASITLYNHMEVKGDYSLNILNGTQVFQYNDDGISPCSKIKESPLTLKPLLIALLDNEGHEIDFKEIVGNGSVTWCIPKTNTLLVNNTDINGTPLDYTGLTGTDRALAANNTYAIYKNLLSFAYSLELTFDYNKRNNNIRLYIVYKDMIFDIYTNFTFPKSGDPGNNGTKFYAKIIPGIIENNNFVSRVTDRVYIDKYRNGYDDQGRSITSFKGELYNGSVETSDPVSFWSCPIAPASSSSSVRSDYTSHFSISSGLNGIATVSGINTGNDENRVDILRAQFGSGAGLKYFAELPICYIDTSQTGNNSSYRVKVRPKTGYSYVTYAEDGSHPDYGNNNTFEIILLKFLRGYYIEQDPSRYTWNWSVKGNLSTPKVSNGRNIAIVNPKESFDGKDLTSKIIVRIYNSQGTYIAAIYIPIYMLINRYGHRAINDWDGNSIELGQNKDGTILAPQVGAGKKDSNNNFTGVLIGLVKYQDNSSETGLFGYDKGLRTIFLDALSGKAEFGKNTSGKITIDPSKKMTVDGESKDVALLYSNNFNVNTYIQNNGKLLNNGQYISYLKTANKGGMIIDLTSPQIAFANGKFNVSKDGKMHSTSGNIGGWQINPTSLLSSNGAVGMSSDNSSGDNKAFFANGNNFYVTHNGFLKSQSGQIANWNISSSALTDGNVGLGQRTFSASNPFTDSSLTARLWAGTSTADAGLNFAVTNQGSLYSKSGKIANWNIGSSALTDGNVGMGSTVASLSDFGLSGNATLNFWGKSGSTYNFGVTSDGRLLSRYGTIGGWNISSATLSAGNKGTTQGGIILNSNGSISGGNNTYSWQVNNDGSATFNNITASGGKIGNWNITNGAIVDNHASTKVALKSDGSIVANEGYIGGIEIYNGGLRTNNWYITNDGKASFTNVQALSGSMGGGTISGGTLSSGSLSGCNVNPWSNYDGSGNTLLAHFGDIVADSITANNGYFRNLDLKNRTLNVSAGFSPVTKSDFVRYEIMVRSGGTTSWQPGYILSANPSDLGFHVFVTADY